MVLAAPKDTANHRRRHRKSSTSLGDSRPERRQDYKAREQRAVALRGHPAPRLFTFQHVCHGSGEDPVPPFLGKPTAGAGSSGNRIVRGIYVAGPGAGGVPCPAATAMVEESPLRFGSPRRSGSTPPDSSCLFGMMEPPILKTCSPDAFASWASPPASAPWWRRRMPNELTLLPSVNGAVPSFLSLELDMTPREMVRGR